VGRDLAADLGVRVGDRLTVQTGTVNDSVRVTALVDLGVKDLNRRTVIVPLRAAQNLLGLPGGATSLDLTSRTCGRAGLADSLRRQYPYKVESWQESNAQLVSALNAQSVSTDADPCGGAGGGGAGHCQRAGGVGGAKAPRDRHPARHGGHARPDAAAVPGAGRVVGALGSVLGIVLAVAMIWLFTQFVRGSDGLPLFAITLRPQPRCRWR
jgi:lipoprotein-releasing system permease protein